MLEPKKAFLVDPTKGSRSQSAKGSKQDPKKKKPLTKRQKIAIAAGGSVGVILVVGLVYMFIGGSRAPRDLPSEDQHIMKVAALWQSYKSTVGHPPASMEELKGWAKQNAKSKLSTSGIDDLDKAFISPRDNQPYGLNKTSNQMMGGMNKVLIYEKTGVEGKRLTASTLGSVAALDDTEFHRWVK